MQRCSLVGNSALSGRGGAIFASKSNVQLVNTWFEGNQASVGGGIYLDRCNVETSSFQGCYLSNQTAFLYGGAIAISASSLRFENTMFESCLAPLGGALYLGSSSSIVGDAVVGRSNSAVAAYPVLEKVGPGIAFEIHISRVTFGNNIAILRPHDVESGKGGAFAFSSSGYDDLAVFSVSELSMARNQAHRGGGGVHWPGQGQFNANFSKLNCSEEIVYPGSYGPCIGTDGVSLRLGNAFYFSNAESGAPLQGNLEVFVLDFYNQTVWSDNETIITLVDVSDSARQVNVQTLPAVSGIANFTAHVLMFAINKTKVLRFESEGYTPSHTFEVRFPLCKPGFEVDTSLNEEGVCSPCAPGSFASASSTNCEPCPAGSYQPKYQALACEVCLLGKFQPAQGQTQCFQCSEGQYANVTGSSTCTACAAGLFSSIATNSHGAFCTSCPSGRAAPGLGSTTCFDCAPALAVAPDRQCQTCFDTSASTRDGVTCLCPVGSIMPHDAPNGMCVKCPPGILCDEMGLTTETVTVRQGYWINSVNISNVFECVNPEACKGGVFSRSELLAATRSASMRGSLGCGENRQGTLCAECRPGFYEWGGSCLTCEISTYVPVILTGLVLMEIYIIVIKQLNRKSTPEEALSRTLMFFLSMARLVMQNESRWLSWITFFEFQASGSTGGKFCVAPLQPLQKLTFNLLLPLISIGLLFLSFSFSYIVVKCRSPTADFWGERPESPGNNYLRTLWDMLVFSYSAITTNSFLYFDCMTIPDSSGHADELLLLRAEPAISCTSSEYYSALVLPIVCLTCITTLFPVVMFLGLWRLRKQHGREFTAFARAGNLVAAYKPSFYAFEPFAIFRRVLFSVTAVFASGLARSHLFFLLSQGFLMTQVILEPFALAKANIAELMGLLALNFIVVLQTGYEETNMPYALEAVITGLIVLTAAVIVLCYKLPSKFWPFSIQRFFAASSKKSSSPTSPDVNQGLQLNRNGSKEKVTAVTMPVCL
eukprot:g61880.t1